MVLYRHKFVNKEMNARTLIVKSVHKVRKNKKKMVGVLKMGLHKALPTRKLHPFFNLLHVCQVSQTKVQLANKIVAREVQLPAIHTHKQPQPFSKD